MSDTEADDYECGCGEVFDTLDELEGHVKDQHPDIYEEKFAD